MARTPSTMLPLGTKLPHFELTNVMDGTLFSSSLLDEKPTLIMFICNHCPFVIHLHQGLTEFIEDVSKNVQIIAISSNDVEKYPQDSPEKMNALFKDLKWNIPYLFDKEQNVAKSFKAACTPDFYLFDSENNLVYRGQFDDSRPGNSTPVTGSDLRAAIDQLVQGFPISDSQRPSLGCNIKWIHGNEPDYFN